MLQALQFLTVIGGRTGKEPGRYVVFFPLIGAALGWFGAGMLGLLAPATGRGVAVVAVLLLWIAITGGRQEVGVIRYLGPLGIIAVLFLELVRWHSIVRLPALAEFELVIALALSRTAMVAIAWLCRPMGDEVRLGAHMTSPGAIVAILIGIVLAFAAGKQGVVTVLGAGFATSLLVQWFDQGTGGVDSASLHGSSLLIEAVSLAVVSCRNCIW